MSDADILTFLTTTLYDSFALTLDDLDQPWRETALNSMQFVYLIFDIEEQYGFTITDAMIDHIQTFRDLITLIATHGVRA